MKKLSTSMIIVILLLNAAFFFFMAFTTAVNPPENNSDLNSDGAVNLEDLSILLYVLEATTTPAGVNVSAIVK